jgi:hypothetical protein
MMLLTLKGHAEAILTLMLLSISQLQIALEKLPLVEMGDAALPFY